MLHAHNGDGVRTSKMVTGEATECAVDLAASLPVVITEELCAVLPEYAHPAPPLEPPRPGEPQD
jgi:hypothetical protein